MAVGDAYVFPGFLTPVLTQLFFPKPPTTFLTCFCRGERRKICRKEKSPQPGIELSTTRLWVQHAQHWATRVGLQHRLVSINVFLKDWYPFFDKHPQQSVSSCIWCYWFTYSLTLSHTTSPRKKPFENIVGKGENAGNQHFLLFPQCFLL